MDFRRSFFKPEWTPLPREGCRNVSGRVLMYEKDRFLVSQLRFASDGTIDEHPAESDAEVFCLKGKGYVSVGQDRSELNEGEWVFWPRGLDHRLWTTSDVMEVLIVHRDVPHGVRL